jgi:hypothetical protein
MKTFAVFLDGRRVGTVEAFTKKSVRFAARRRFGRDAEVEEVRT